MWEDLLYAATPTTVGGAILDPSFATPASCCFCRASIASLGLALEALAVDVFVGFAITIIVFSVADFTDWEPLSQTGRPTTRIQTEAIPSPTIAEAK